MAEIRENKTISDLKSIIISAFNSVISDEITQQLFAARLELWNEAEALYTTNVEFVGVFIGYRSLLNSARHMLDEMNAPFTKQSKTIHDKGSTVTTEHTGSDTTTYGQQSDKTKTYVYPQGYTGGSDPAYLSTEGSNSSDERSDSLERGTTDTTASTGADTDTFTDFDLAVFMEHGGSAAALLVNYVDKCIYDIKVNAMGC